MSHLTEMWDRLQTLGDPAQYVRLRLKEVSGCAAYAAKRVRDGNEALLLEVATAAIPGQLDYPQSIGFEVRAEAMDPGRSGTTRLLLTLTNHRYRDVFHSLAADVVGCLATATGETEAIRILISRLTRWQDFLRKHGPGGLSLEARRGLYGELAFLRDDLLGNMKDIDAVRAWMGCQGATHDFQLPGGSVEVKTTCANPPSTFHVSNAGQLDDAGLPALFVCLTALDEAAGALESLPEMVDCIRVRLDGQALDEFNGALMEAGFLNVHLDQYGDPRYSVRSKRLFRVSDGFPRITATTLPNGVEDIQYVVAIGACLPFEVNITRLTETVLLGPDKGCQ